MKKCHAARCSMEGYCLQNKLAEMCREAEEMQATEGINFDEIIEEEKYGMGTAWGMFRRQKTMQEQETDDIVYKCFLCQGKWTGTSEEELRQHLEKDHKVLFQIEELIELSKPEGAKDEEERLLANTKANSGEKISSYFILGT